MPAVTESTLLEIYTLCQSLPGSGSAQIVTTMGAIFGGLGGAISTVFLWHSIGVIAMTIAGVIFHEMEESGSAKALSLISEFAQYTIGLVSAAFAFVLIATDKIIRKAVGFNRLHATICIVTAYVAVLTPPEDAGWIYAVLLLAGGTTSLIYHEGLLHIFDNILGCCVSREQDGEETEEVWETGINPLLGACFLVTFFSLTLYAFMIRPSGLLWRLFSILWITGACTFGGGIVVVPLLLSQIVDSGLLPSSTFLVGFGLFGFVPGPMFNLASFLGGAIDGFRGALIATFAMLSPGIIVLLGILPFWQRIRSIPQVRSFKNGALAVAAGLVLNGVYMLSRKALTGPAAYALVISSCAMAIMFETAKSVRKQNAIWYNILFHGAMGGLLRFFEIGGPFTH